MLIGSMATGLCATGGFCAGSSVVVDHQVSKLSSSSNRQLTPYVQRINGTAFVFSAAMPALLAVSASEGIQILTSTPSLLETLHDNIRAIRSVLEKLSPDLIELPSHPASAVIHINIRSGLLQNATPTISSNGLLAAPLTDSPPKRKPAVSSLQAWTPANLSKGTPSYDWVLEDKVLQEVVDEALAQGVLITRAKRLRGQEAVEPRSSIKMVATAAKECAKAAIMHSVRSRIAVVCAFSSPSPRRTRTRCGTTPSQSRHQQSAAQRHLARTDGMDTQSSREHQHIMYSYSYVRNTCIRPAPNRQRNGVQGNFAQTDVTSPLRPHERRRKILRHRMHAGSNGQHNDVRKHAFENRHVLLRHATSNGQHDDPHCEQEGRSVSDGRARHVCATDLRYEVQERR